MKRILVVLALVAIVANFAYGQRSARTRQNEMLQDQSAVLAIVNHWQQLWDRFDASVLAGDYVDDADWLNAFGVRLHGSEKILEYMNGMVKRPNVQERHTTWEDPTVRFVRPDVAIAFRAYKTVGHKTPAGVQMPQRNTHCTWVLSKDDGKWRIVSQMISDEVSLDR